MHDFGNRAGENVVLMVRALSLLIGLVIVLSFTIQEACADPETLTLSCDGKLTNTMSSDNDTKTETVTKMGLLVNLAEGTVMGFGTPARIEKTDTVSVNFVGDSGGSSVQGTVDRITGGVIASTQLYSASAKKLISSYNWDLHCKPTKRVF
jgi:hypothetical protein